MFDVIYSAIVGRNADVLRDVLQLYAEQESVILDMTYSTGRFWLGEWSKTYDIWTNDVDPACNTDFHFDLRAIELPDESFDMVVLDPPYAVRTTGERSAASHERYGYGGLTSIVSSPGNIELYKGGAEEAARLLRRDGILLMKCQDEIESGKFRPHHLTLCSLDKFRLEDIFIVVRPDKPMWDPKWKRQHHARKNHSYLIVHRKRR